MGSAERLVRELQAKADRAAMLDYLRGEWVDCIHDGIVFFGCPTCDWRWSSDVRRVVREHRDRVRTRVAELEANLDWALARVRDLEEPQPIVRDSADPSSERTRRAVGYLLETLSHEVGDDSTAAWVIEALAVLLGVDRG